MDDMAFDAASEPKVRSKHVQKPTQHVKDLLEGRRVTSDLPKGPKVTPGVQLPTEEPSILEAMLAKLAPGYQEEDLPMAADFLEEYAMGAEISEVEALEPHTLAEAKSRPDWPLWEKASTLQCPTDSIWNPVIPPEWHQNGTGIRRNDRNPQKWHRNSLIPPEWHQNGTGICHKGLTSSPKLT